MKKIIYFLLICPLLSFSQSYVIEYDVKLNVLKRNGLLFINNDEKSFYYETQKNKIDDEQKTDEDGTINQTIFLGKNNNQKRFQIYETNKDTLYNVDYLDEEQIINFEVFPKMEWDIIPEIKKIDTYTCNKAEIVFRGRKYTAWFTTEVPIQLGPWKFNGLPGAILEVYDETKTFAWTAIKIKQMKNAEKLNIEDNLNRISLQDFVKENEKSKQIQMDRMLLKFGGRGTKIVKSKKTNKGRETIFEWEKETKED
jgi:GLPGLI family protein